MTIQKIVVCPHCMAKNRVSTDKFAANPQCGQCHQALFTCQCLNLNENNFSQYVRNTEVPVLVDLWADWCGPCKMMAPQFAKAAQQFPQVLFGKIDTEANPRLSAAFNVRSIPTLVLLHAGQEVARVSGAMQQGQIQEWLSSQLKDLT